MNIMHLGKRTGKSNLPHKTPIQQGIPNYWREPDATSTSAYANVIRNDFLEVFLRHEPNRTLAILITTEDTIGIAQIGNLNPQATRIIVHRNWKALKSSSVTNR